MLGSNERAGKWRHVAHNAAQYIAMLPNFCPKAVYVVVLCISFMNEVFLYFPQSLHEKSGMLHGLSHVSCRNHLSLWYVTL
jgi:hypothetical protein